MTFLPGTTPVVFPSPLPMVRGFQPAATRYFVDGVEVPTVFHALAGPTLLPPDAVDSLTVVRGAPPASIQGGTGGAVDLQLVSPDSPGVHGTTAMDLLRLGTLNSWVSEDRGTRVLVGASVLWTPLLIAGESRSPEWDPSRAGLRAELFSYLARVEQRVGEGNVRLLALGAMDTAGSASNTDLVGGSVSTHRFDARIAQPVAGGALELGLGFGRDALGAELGGPSSQSHASTAVLQLQSHLTWSKVFSPSAAIAFGLQTSQKGAELTQGSRTRVPDINGEAQDPVVTEQTQGIGNLNELGAWGEAVLGSDPAWQWTLGLRADRYDLEGQDALFVVEPRVATRKLLKENVWLAAGVGLTHDRPTWFFPLPVVDLASLRFGLQEALHTDAELTWDLAPDLRLSAAGFVNPLGRTLELSPLDRDFLQTLKGTAEDVEPAHATHGLAYGFELSARHELRHGWFGMVSYSYATQRRQQAYVTRDDYGAPEGSASAWLPTQWTVEDAINLVAGRAFDRWTFSVAGHFHTGVLEAGRLSSWTQREGLDQNRPGPRWIDADLNNVRRMPPYFRADVHVSRVFLTDRIAWELTLDVQNITFSRELMKTSYQERAESLQDRASGNVTLTQSPSGIGVPAFPLPMIGLAARY